jgi:hypothetical protein
MKVTWEELKKDAEILDGRICKDLGTCEVKFGFVSGGAMLEIIPASYPLRSNGEHSSIMIELGNADWIREDITNLYNNVLEINDEENIRLFIIKKELEGLLQKRKLVANAIKDLEV